MKRAKVAATGGQGSKISESYLKTREAKESEMKENKNGSESSRSRNSGYFHQPKRTVPGIYFVKSWFSPKRRIARY